MKRTLRVMLVEDSESDALLLIRELTKGGFDVSYERIDEAKRMKAAFVNERWDVVFCDHSMPGFSGNEALELYMQSGHDIPFIFVSGTIGEDAAVAAMKAGAHDYVMKSNIKRLIPAVERELREAEIRRQRHEAEEKMREQQAHLQQLFENATVGIVAVDLKGQILDVNRAFEDMFLHGREEIRNRILDDLVVPPSHLEESDALVQAALKGERFQKETVRKRKDGKLLDVVVTGFPIMHNAKPIGIYVVYLDVTERKEFEARLIRAQRLESIGTLAGGIAHDFNNILGIVIGQAVLIDPRRRTVTTEELAKGVDGISRAAQRGAAVVRQLMTFARKTDVSYGTVALNEIAKETAGLIRETFPADIIIETCLSTSIPLIYGDPTQIHQVLLNLCVNARDAMPDGGQLKISTSLATIENPPPEWAKATAREYVCFSVSDTGIGMDEATRARIFEPFFTTKEVGHGTGLGLATVYGIVQNHRGFIDVASSPGKGSTFQVYLPYEFRQQETKTV